MRDKLDMRTRVVGNGEIYRIKKVLKLVEEFKTLSWIEQQSFLMGADHVGIKPPPNKYWAKKLSLKETKNSRLT